MEFDELLIILKNSTKEQIINRLDDLQKDFSIDDISFALYTVYNSDEIIEIRKIRIQREELRRKVLVRDKNCIISGNQYECCEIAHIKPFYTCADNEKYDINNTILLSAELYKLFNNYVWSINPKTSKIMVDDNAVNNNSYPIYKFKDKKIKLTEGQLKYIEQHFKEFINRQ